MQRRADDDLLKVEFTFLDMLEIRRSLYFQCIIVHDFICHHNDPYGSHLQLNHKYKMKVKSKMWSSIKQIIVGHYFLKVEFN